MDKVGRSTKVTMDGELMTLFEISKKYSIPYSTVRERHIRGRELTVSHRRKVEIVDGKKVCKGLCGKLLPLTEFHVHGQNKGSSRRFSKCRICRGREQYQRRLFNAWESGDPSVVECVKCEGFMRRGKYKECVDCRDVLGNRGGFKRAELTPDEFNALELKLTDYHKSCKSCGVPITMENYVFSIRKKLAVRPQCNTCWCSDHAEMSRRKKADKDPENHLQCDNCDRPFGKYVAGGRRKDGTHTLRVDCPYCGSEDIDRYLSEQIT